MLRNRTTLVLGGIAALLLGYIVFVDEGTLSTGELEGRAGHVVERFVRARVKRLELTHGDVHLVPAGYHGPSTAQPEYPMYFLNVLAGPGPERTMAFCDDPDHHWIRATWEDVGQDPRLPMTSATGRVAR